MNHRGQEEKEWTLWGLNPRPHAIYASMQSMRATTVLSARYHTYYKFIKYLKNCWQSKELADWQWQPIASVTARRGERCYADHVSSTSKAVDSNHLATKFVFSPPSTGGVSPPLIPRIRSNGSSAASILFFGDCRRLWVLQAGQILL